MYFDTHGVIRYSPKVPNQKGNALSPNWWVVLDLDKNISRYYRRLYEYSIWHTEKLQPPMWGCHVVIVRNEEPAVKARWELRAGEDLWIRIFPDEMFTNGNAYWCNVYCPAANVLRASLGLKARLDIGFHLCLGYKQAGRISDEQKNTLKNNRT